MPSRREDPTEPGRPGRPGRGLAVALAAALAVAGTTMEPSRALAQAVQDSALAIRDTAGAIADVADTLPGDTTTIEPVPDEQDRVDERIRSELQAVFDRIPPLSGVLVTVEAGVVRLVGGIPDAETGARAVELAEGREGVVFVDDSGLSSPTTGDRLEDIWSRLRAQGRDALLLLPLLVVAAVIVVLFAGLAWGAGRWPGPRGPGRLNPFLRALLQRLLQFGLVIAGVLIALELLDATALVGAVIGTAGLAGLAVGFAFKDIAENYLAGVILSLRQPFAKNDLILVGGHEGKVVRLTGRETVLMTLDGNHVQIPNATVFREPVLNYTRNPRRRFMFEVGVTTETDPARALDVGCGVLRDMEGVEDQPPPEALVLGFGDGTMQVRFFGWVDQRGADFGRVRSEAVRLVKAALEDAGIETPSPERRVLLAGGAAEIPSRPARPTPAPPGPPETPQRDVSVDRTIDGQIEEDRRRSTDEEDLLEEPS